MPITVTMLQNRLGENGAMWVAGNSYSASDEFGSSLINSNYATGTLPTPPQSAFTAAQVAALSGVSGAGYSRLVILGASGASGMGATGYTTDPGLGGTVPAASWAGMLQTELTAQGFIVVNLSISGNNTAASLARFSADVVPLRPTHVLLATGTTNDGFEADPAGGARAYVTNTLELARRCQSIGAVPIVGTGVLPTRAWNATHLAWARWIIAQFERAGLATLNFVDPVLSRSASNLLTAFSADNSHLNDAGQTVAFRSIPPTFFRCAHLNPVRGQQFRAGRTAVNNDGGSAIPMTFIQSVGFRVFSGWTVALPFVGSASLATGKAFWWARGAGNTQLRLRNPGGVYELTDSAGVSLTSAVSTSNTSQQMLVVSKSTADGWIDFWLNGVNVGTSTAFASIAQEQWGFDIFGRPDSLGSNAAGLGINGFGLWRTSHAPDMLDRISRGYWPMSSAEILTDELRDPPLARLANSARADEAVSVTAGVPFTLA